jgi:hypothetical protein
MKGAMNGMISSAEQFQHKLVVQAKQIEAVFRSADQPLSVGNGTINGRWAIFELSPLTRLSPAVSSELQQKLTTTLKVPSVRLRLADEKPSVAVLQPPADPVELLELMAALPRLSPTTAVLGLDNKDRPVLMNLNSSSITNVLFSGTAGCGKAALMRTLFVSLALQNRQSQVQLAVVDFAADRGHLTAPGGDFYPLGFLPHMMAPVLTDLEEFVGFLGRLNEEVRYRLERRTRWPLMVIALSDLQELLDGGGQPVTERLAQLLQAGPEAGVRTILSTSHPLSANVQQLIRGNVTVRLSGRQPGSRAAWAATGVCDSGAEYLPDNGQFIALSAGTELSFRPATCSDYNLHLTLERLHRRHSRAIITRPAPTRPRAPFSDSA